MIVEPYVPYWIQTLEVTGGFKVDPWDRKENPAFWVRAEMMWHHATAEVHEAWALAAEVPCSCGEESCLPCLARFLMDELANGAFDSIQDDYAYYHLYQTSLAAQKRIWLDPLPEVDTERQIVVGWVEGDDGFYPVCKPRSLTPSVP